MDIGCPGKFEETGKIFTGEKQLGLEEVDDILRCRGRLSNSDLDLETKTPIILPTDHSFTRLVIDCCHPDVMHGGVRETLAELCWKY